MVLDFANGFPNPSQFATGETRFIVLRDQSSSMEWVPQFPYVWNRQVTSLATLLPSVRITLYSVNCDIQKVTDDIALRELPLIEPKDWRYGEHGMLRGGSRLGDAIVRGCQKAKQFRRRGARGPLGVFLLTDGWAKGDTVSPEVTRQWLEHARNDLDVQFRVFGFIRSGLGPKMDAFLSSVGIRSEENQVIHYADTDCIDKSMQTSLERLADEVFITARSDNR
ncbi:MAG: hypothetical protein KDD69_06160 [Bdellovibrionales bacterium]|nr:hypothetical protein [Bdellovibrionales bacterium]